MKYEILNLSLSILTLLFSIRMVYFTFKEPSDSFSTNFKGHILGFILFFSSFQSLIGKFNLFITISEIFKSSFKLKTEIKQFSFAFFVLFLLTVLVILNYLRMKRCFPFSKVPSFPETSKIKNTIDWILLFLAFCTVILYLILN